MKTPFFAFVVAIFLSLLQATAADHPLGDSQVIDTGGTIHVTNAPVYLLLDVYTHVSGLGLITASNVSHLVSNNVVLPDGPGGGDFLREIEKALVDQWGIVITRLDDKRVSVTYNDALKVAPVKEKPTSPIRSSSRHLTEAEVLVIAKPLLPLPVGESYHVGFEDGTTWVIWTEGVTPTEGRAVVLIRDIDGHAQVVNRL